MSLLSTPADLAALAQARRLLAEPPASDHRMAAVASAAFFAFAAMGVAVTVVTTAMQLPAPAAKRAPS